LATAVVAWLSEGKYAFTDSSGERAEFDVSPGEIVWMEATDHATENVGDTTIRALMFERKWVISVEREVVVS
jgi:hypothetical protein